MPRIRWEEIDKIIHGLKDDIEQVHKIEKQTHNDLRKLKVSLLNGIEELHAIVLNQVDDNHKKKRGKKK